jgi:hypothetical protein
LVAEALADLGGPPRERQRAPDVAGEAGHVRLDHREEALAHVVGVPLRVATGLHEEARADRHVAADRVLDTQARGDRRRSEVVALLHEGPVRAVAERDRLV